MAQPSDATPVISAYEAEQIVSQLKPFSIDEVGTSRYVFCKQTNHTYLNEIRWMQQHEFIEKLNLQAHLNARTFTDEYVLEYLISYDKVRSLITCFRLTVTASGAHSRIDRHRVVQGEDLSVS